MMHHNANELWWQRYRTHQRPRLNFELILRKSVSDTAKEYLDRCGIAGVKEIREPKISIKQRLTYAAIFIASLATLVYVLSWTKSQTLSSPLVLTEESSTYPIDSIDFPAVALCNTNRISQKALYEFATEISNGSNSKMSKKYKWLRGKSFEYIVEYFRIHGKLIDFTFTEDMKTYHNEVIRKPEDTQHLVHLMKQLAPKCDEMLVKCAWGGAIADCKDLFDTRRTIRGHCCVFNYHRFAKRFNRSTEAVKRQVEKGGIFGLHVVLNPLDDDYSYPIRVCKGFEVFLFDPTNYPDPTGGRTIQRFVGINEDAKVEIQSVKQLATPEVRRYPKSTRKCLFRDEQVDPYGDMYSHSACLLACRVRAVRSLCKCLPYYIPMNDELDSAVCTVERLRCLNKYKEKFYYQYPYGASTFDGLEMEAEQALACPDCLPDCEFTHHISKAFKLPVTLARAAGSQFESKGYVSTFAKEYNATNKCLLSVFQSTGDGNLNRLDIISYWFEILSNVGGYAGILLGLSIICGMETIYFLIFRFPCNLYTNYKKYY